MVMAIKNIRVQTLTRQINKANLQMTLLAQKQQTLTSSSYMVGTEYKKYYSALNGVYGTISAEQEDAFTSKLEQLEPIYRALNEADNDIDIEIASLETQIQAWTKELESVEKLEAEKKEVPKLS